jgi:4-amino-4-deoxychorismate lyase
MLVNGLDQDLVELSDRAIHYGDGAFETLRIENRRLVHWHRHLRRLTHTCKILQIPLDINALEYEVNVILRGADSSCILKVIVSRGSGGRGYRPPDYWELQKTGVRLMRCQHPVSENPVLAGLKHLNRLDQVLASMELSADCEEGLMLTTAGKVVEGTRTNVFLARQGRLRTPALDLSGVAGIKREIILEQCSKHGIDVDVCHIDIEELQDVDEMFVCNSVLGIWPVIEWRNGNQCRHLPRGVLTRKVQELTKDAD